MERVAKGNRRSFGWVLWIAVLLPFGAGAAELSIRPLLKKAEGVQAVASRKYHLTVNWEADNNRFEWDRVVVILPYPQNSQYVRVTNVRLGANGEVRKAQNDADLSYVRYEMAGSALPKPNGRVRFGYEADVELFALSTSGLNNTPPTAFLPNRQPSPFVGATTPFVEPGNATIRTISDRLWEEAHHSRVDYARKAYEYVAANYRYLNPGTGIHPLSTLLAQGGGDCGNLSSIYVSLLRARNIPARHLVGMHADGTNHAFAEFMAPGIGWVPVDVTAKNGDPAGDYFGRLPLADAIIVWQTDLNTVVEKEPGVSYTAPLMQGYSWWLWGRGDWQRVAPSFTVRATPLN